MNWELLAFGVYFFAMIAISVVFFLKSKGDSEDYFIGGRSLGPWVTALSAQASDMSAWLLMGLPGSILAFGFGKMWIGIGLAIGTAANWIITARRLRKFSKAAGDAITLPQYFANRFAAKSRAIQIICALIFLVFFTVYVASSFVAGTTVFGALFPDLPSKYAMVFFAIIIIIYTFFGGFKGVCWTDFFQGILMFCALLAVPIVILAVQQLDTSLLANVYEYMDGATGAVTTCTFGTGLFDSSWQDIVSGLGWGLGYFGMPHILIRFFGIEKPSMLKKSMVVAIVWVVVTLLAATVIAYFGRMIVAEELLTTGTQSMVFIVLARKYFPAFLAGILMAAIIAASMSTADSQLLVASSSFTTDIYKPIFRNNASEKEILWVGRAVVIIVAIVAYFIASSQGAGAQAIMNIVDNAWGGFGSAFGPTVILSLFWKRFNEKGAIAGIVVGALVDVVWALTLSGSTNIYEIIPGFICGMIAAVVVTLLTKAPSQEVYDLFEKATAPDFDE